MVNDLTHYPPNFKLYHEIYSKEELDGYLAVNEKAFSHFMSTFPFGTLNKTLHGFPNYEHEYNSIEEFKKNSVLQRVLKTENFLDKDNKPIIPTYTFNEYGFRSESWNSKEEGIIFLGCSDTFGTSQFLEKTWPYLVAEHFKVRRYNLAKPGGSNDSAYRFLKNHIANIPGKYVCMLEIELTRTEQWEPDKTIDINGASLVDLHKSKEYRYLSEWYLKHGSDPRQALIMYNKNIDAIKYLCKENNKQFIGVYNPCYDNSISQVNPIYNVKSEDSLTDLAGDCVHKGSKFQEAIANEMIRRISEIETAKV